MKFVQSVHAEGGHCGAVDEATTGGTCFPVGMLVCIPTVPFPIQFLASASGKAAAGDPNGSIVGDPGGISGSRLHLAQAQLLQSLRNGNQCLSLSQHIRRQERDLSREYSN